MPRLDKETKEQIKNLSAKDLQEIVLKLASRNKSAYDFIIANYLDKEFGEEELFEEVKSDLGLLFYKGYKGFSHQLRMANMLSACTKRINEFTKVSKNKSYEAELLLFVLKEPFSMPEDFFGTCFTAFDYKAALMLKRLMNLVEKKLHVDYRIQYVETINQYLAILHKKSRHIDMVYEMPRVLYY